MQACRHMPAQAITLTVSCLNEKKISPLKKTDPSPLMLLHMHAHTRVHTHTHTHTQPRYLKISSILFHVLLNTQAQLLHPLQLGLDSGAVSLQRPGTQTEGHEFNRPATYVRGTLPSTLPLVPEGNRGYTRHLAGISSKLPTKKRPVLSNVVLLAEVT